MSSHAETARALLAAVFDWEGVPLLEVEGRALARLEEALAAARQQGRAEVAALLEQGAARVAPAGKRTNQVDQHTAEVLRDYARQAREGGEG